MKYVGKADTTSPLRVHFMDSSKTTAYFCAT